MPLQSDAPVIGLTVELLDAPWYEGVRRFQLFTAYTECIRTAGAIPLLIPADAREQELDILLDKVDGVLMTGGDDADLSLIGGPPPESTCKPMPKEQQNMNFQLLDLALKRNLPVFGICLGMQMIGLHFKAEYTQHLPQAEQHTKGIEHRVIASSGSLLASIVGEDAFAIRSYHHQALASAGDSLTVCAHDETGLIEAVEHQGFNFCLGVQWHPEKSPNSPQSQALFSSFIDAARSYRIQASIA